MAERSDRSGRASWQARGAPAGTRIYAVGDIHGHLGLLETLLRKIRSDAAGSARNMLVFLGDYIDRGPASKGVVDRLLHLERPGWTVVTLRGNHEQMLLDFVRAADAYPLWHDYGGAETLRSYGVRPPPPGDDTQQARARDEFVSALPALHRAFFDALPYSHAAGDYLFVHAGVRPSVALERQDPGDLIWIRDEFLLCDRMLEKVVVHGHTPAPRPVVKANRIGVDTGAYATGRLTAAVLEGECCRFLSAEAAASSP